MVFNQFILRRILRFFQQRFFIVVIGGAVLTGILYIIPQLFIARDLNQQGIPYLVMQYGTHNDETKGYIPRAREVYDGHFPVLDIFTDRVVPVPLNHLPPLIASVPFFLFQGNVNRAYLFSQFFFSSLIFICFFLLGKVVLRTCSWAILLAFTATLTPMARHLNYGFLNIKNFSNVVLKNFIPAINTQLDRLFLDKIDDPLITFLIYIPFLIFLFCFWKKPTYFNAVWLSLLMGLLFYTYLHYWAYGLVVLILAGIYIFFTRKEYPKRFDYFCIVCGLVLLMLVPYLINYYQFMHLDSSKDWIARNGGLEYGRNFRGWSIINYYIFYAILGILTYVFFWRGGDKKQAILFWIFLIAMPIVWNSQVIIGFTVTANHWLLVFAPVGLLMIFTFFSELLKHLNRRFVLLLVTILIGLLVTKKIMNAMTFLQPNTQIIARHTLDSDIIESWKWMNKNISGEPKMISPSFMTTIFLSIYTSARPYLPFLFNTFISTREFEERFLIANKLFGISNTQLKSRLTARLNDNCVKVGEIYQRQNLECNSYTIFNLGNAGNNMYGNTFRQKEYNSVDDIEPIIKIPESKLVELITRYNDLKINLATPVVEYFYYGPWEKELTNKDKDLDGDSNLELVFRNENVKIYKNKVF